MNSLAALLGTTVGKLLDPVSFIVVLIVTLCSKQKHIIIVAALVAAIITESVLTSMQATRSWGQGIAPGFLASLLHAVFLFWVVSKFRKNDPVQAETDSDEKT